MDPITVLTSIGTTLATNALSNAKAPAQAIDDIMEIVGFGRLKHFADKKRTIREIDLNKFVQEIAVEMSYVDSENFTDPKLSVIGPALEAAKYYIEEPDIRSMFAKIIGSSVDSSKSLVLHESFVEIVKQLSKNDTIVFKSLTSYPETNYFPICRSLIKNTNELLIDKYFYDAYFLKGIVGDFSAVQQSLSLYNLERLGLISCDWSKYYEKSVYDFFDDYEDIKRLRSVHGHDIVSSQIGLLSITTLGQAFYEVCLG